MIKIAVLLATYNRKEKTLACLASVFDQKQKEDYSLEVFMTDDASADSTAEAVKEKYPAVNLFMGSGSLFWAGGMRNTWNEALISAPDYYLLLNDDTVLDDIAINKLLRYNKQHPDKKPAICIGTTMDNDGRISYGGHKLYNERSVQYYNIFSETEYVECDLANANIMLVPSQAVDEIGILSANYTHSIADFDYSLKAKKAGFKILIVPGVIGYCTDDHGKNWKSANTSLKDRISYLKSPKGLAYHEYLYFIKDHFPLHLPAAFIKLWAKTLFPVIWDKLK